MRNKNYWGIKQIEEVNKVLTFALLAFGLGSVAIGLAYLVRTLKPSPLFLISMMALSIGWIFGKGKIRSWWVGLLIFTLGLLFNFFWVSDLWEPLLNWLHLIDQFIWQVLYRSDYPVIDFNVLWAVMQEIGLRLITIWTDFGFWFKALISGQPFYNYNAIALVWGLVVWFVSAWAGWFQRRREHPWIAILPAGLLLASSLGYTYGPTIPLFPLVFVVLSLSGLTFYIQRARSWNARSMDYPIKEHSENVMIIFGIALGFMIAAALVPRISVHSIIAVIQDWIAPPIEVVEPIFESFGLEGDLESLGEMGSALHGDLPRSHIIGAGPELSKQIVMSVQLEEDISKVKALAVPLYWRSITYDRYTGYGWESSEVLLRRYQAEATLDIPELKEEGDYHNLTQAYQFNEPNDLIYAAGEIISLDTDFKIAWRIVPGITSTLQARGDFFAASQERKAYNVQSAVPLVSESQLLAAEGLYPAWISMRYLALPTNISQRVINLARDLTRNTPRPYEKVRAIEAHLRTYEYEINLPEPPRNRELSDYFLFELRKGYCDYFSTAMIVLTRAIGVPARLAVGYTSGRYNAEREQFIVAEDNAHSWVEIYFTGIGWVPFEPTPAQVTLQRSNRVFDPATDREQSVWQKSQQQDNLWVEWLPDRWWYWPVNFLIGAAVLIMVWLYLDRWYLRWLVPVRTATKIYRRLYRFGRLIGSPARLGDTPYEFANDLLSKIGALSRNSRLERYFYPVAEDIQTLTDAYVLSIYSSHGISRNTVLGAITCWKRLRWRLLFAGVVSIRHQSGRG